MATLAPLWLEKTEQIRDDPKDRKRAGWIAEMWGYVFAAADLGLRHAPRAMAHFPMDYRSDLPLIHYCDPARDASSGWVWDKKRYVPWECVADPPPGISPPSRLLINLVSEYAARQGHQLMPGAARYRNRGVARDLPQSPGLRRVDADRSLERDCDRR
jgi:hypothetical protein